MEKLLFGALILGGIVLLAKSGPRPAQGPVTPVGLRVPEQWYADPEMRGQILLIIQEQLKRMGYQSSMQFFALRGGHPPTTEQAARIIDAVYNRFAY